MVSRFDEESLEKVLISKFHHFKADEDCRWSRILVFLCLIVSKYRTISSKSFVLQLFVLIHIYAMLCLWPRLTLSIITVFRLFNARFPLTIMHKYTSSPLHTTSYLRSRLRSLVR